MVFNTGAALLDAIVLAVVSKEKEGPTDIRLRRMCGKRSRFQNPHCIRFAETAKGWIPDRV